MQKIPVTRDGKTGSDIFMIASRDVVKIEWVKNHYVVHTLTGSYYWCSSLEAMEEWLFEEGFRLLDQNNVVNMNYVTNYDVSKGRVTLQNPNLPVLKQASAAWIHKDHIRNLMHLFAELRKLESGQITEDEDNDLFENILSREEDSRFARSYAMVQAIYQRTKAERRLEQSEQRYRSLFHNNPDIVVSFDREGYCTSANPALFTLTGYEEHDLLYRTMEPMIAPEYREQWSMSFCETLAGHTREFEVKLLHRNGHAIDFAILHVPIIVSDQTIGVYMIGKDLSAQKQAEEMLIRSEKLSVVGQMAAGVAHEIRNPLTSLKGFLQLMQAKIQGYDHYFSIMLNELERINLIVSEFLVIAKPHTVQFQYRDVSEIIEHTITLLKSQANMNDIELVYETVGPIAPVHCDENQLKQVFINLINNAMDAMPGGGTIRVELQQPDDRMVRLRFVDQGCGIPEDRIPRLGEPFFTTKEKGTGLGLMISFKIIENHKGRMFISSEQGIGTTIDIMLPVSTTHKNDRNE